MKTPGNAELKKRILAAAAAVMFGGACVPALADTEALIKKLYEKGVLTDEEYEEMSAEVREEQREEAAATAAATAKDNDPNKMVGSFKDGVKWKSQDGRFGLQLHGRVQLDYRSSDLPGSEDDFKVRRAYLGVKGKLYTKWTYELTWDLAKGRSEYAYINYKWNDSLQIRGGQFKFPFGFSQLTSSRFVDFMERSYTDDFEPGKDQGLAIYGQPKKNVFSYALGYANGGGGRGASPDTEKKDLIARVAVNFAPMAKLDKAVLHLGYDYRDGAFNNAGTDFDRTANGLELVGAYGPFKLQSEIQAIDLATNNAANPDVDVYYVSALWLITGEQYVKNYSINGMKAIKPLNPLSAGGMGAWELGVQMGELDADQSQAGTDNVKSTTVGIKWIPETNIRFLLNWVQNDYETPITVSGQPISKETQVNARAQLYF